MPLNKEQHKIIEFLYESPDTIFSYDQLKNSGISFTDKDWQLLQKEDLINHNGHNKNTYTFQISSKGRAYYEYFVALKEEETRHKRHEEKLEKNSREANVIAIMALVIAALALISSTVFGILSLLLH